MLAVLASGPGSILRALLEAHGVTSITGDWAGVRATVLGVLPAVRVLAVEDSLCGPGVLGEFRNAGFQGRLAYVTRAVDLALDASAKLHGADSVFTLADLNQIVQLVASTESAPSAAISTDGSPHRFAIDALEVDRRLGRLWIRGVEVRITRRPWQALEYLLRHRGRIVSAVELGSDAFQEKLDASTVRDHLRELRRSLGDMASLVQTPRRGGYLIA
jgi:hypothetical protein